jgi:hypothetical protein
MRGIQLVTPIKYLDLKQAAIWIRGALVQVGMQPLIKNMRRHYTSVTSGIHHRGVDQDEFTPSAIHSSLGLILLHTALLRVSHLCYIHRGYAFKRTPKFSLAFSGESRL